MFSKILCDTTNVLDVSLDTFQGSISKFLLNRVNTRFFDDIKIFSYGASYKLNQVAVISVEQGVVLIKPFDKSNLSIISNEINKLNMDFNPIIVSDFIKVVYPKLTFERRLFFIKKMKDMSENSKISMRNIRRNVNQKIKELSKDGKISRDDEKRFLSKIQILIDDYIIKIDMLFKKKKKELSEV